MKKRFIILLALALLFPAATMAMTKGNDFGILRSGAIIPGNTGTGTNTSTNTGTGTGTSTGTNSGGSLPGNGGGLNGGTGH